MSLTVNGWKNKGGTSGRSCKCDSWKKHWEKFSNSTWPSSCSVSGCSGSPTDGGHVINAKVPGEKIVPLCSSCNKIAGEFTLKGSITWANANTSETCDK